MVSKGEERSVILKVDAYRPADLAALRELIVSLAQRCRKYRSRRGGPAFAAGRRAFLLQGVRVL